MIPPVLIYTSLLLTGASLWWHLRQRRINAIQRVFNDADVKAHHVTNAFMGEVAARSIALEARLLKVESVLVGTPAGKRVEA